MTTSPNADRFLDAFSELERYEELVLDRGWDPQAIVFDPFFGNDALDLWGFDAPPRLDMSWRDGRITFAAEAKSRIAGGDGLQSLRRAFDRLVGDPDATVSSGHRRKWDELVRLADQSPIDVLLVADNARWWFVAESLDRGLRLIPAEG